jgi:glycosyltransferase involved in cell wall biosynthesis
VNRTRKSLNIKENTNIIGAVMTPRPVKRLDRMFDMIDMISESRDVVLIIVGESEYNEKYRREAQSRGINNRIRWVGHQHATNLSKFYSLFDITIMTSEFESFGQSISESYLCGTPCVAFDTGGMSEQINHQSTGYLVTQGDIKSFSDYVIDLLSDIEQRNKFAMAGKEYVRQRFVLRQVSKQYSKLISQLIDHI